MKLHRLATYGWYRVSDADAGRLARHNAAKLPKHGYELRVQWPDGRYGYLKRTKLILSDEFQNARGWVWAVRLDTNEWGRVPEPGRDRRRSQRVRRDVSWHEMAGGNAFEGKSASERLAIIERARQAGMFSRRGMSDDDRVWLIEKYVQGAGRDRRRRARRVVRRRR